jgi:lauroyl/myristoyl acyltransferase
VSGRWRVLLDTGRNRFEQSSRAPDGRSRPDAPFGRGPIAARVLGRVIDGAAQVGCRLPAGIAHRLAVVGGYAEWATRPGKRCQLAENLAHAIGAPPDSIPVRRLVRREIINEARRSADLLWAIGRPADFLACVEVVGGEYAVAATTRGRGVVLAGIHLGGWEVAAAVPARVIPVPTTVIVADNWLAWAIQHVRSAAGLRVVYGTRSALGPARVLHRGEALLVLGDDASGRSSRRHTVRFCDASADLPAGVVALARLSGSPIVPFGVLPIGPRRWRVEIQPPIEPPARDACEADEASVLQRVADRWTAMICEHPDQWAASFPIAWRARAATVLEDLQ